MNFKKLKSSVTQKIIGIIGSLLTLIFGSIIFFYIYVGLAFGADDEYLLIPLLGGPIVIISAIYWILKITWSKKVAIWVAIILAILPISYLLLAYFY